MKRCVACWCGALSLLAAAAPAFADDAPVGSSLQAGGLKPPEAVPADQGTAPPNPTEAKLDLADKQDSGRGLEFVWLNAEAGPELLGLTALRDKHLVEGIGTKPVGMAYGAGAGVRLLAFTFGARFRLGNFPDWQVWTLNAEAGMHIPLGRVEPYFTVGAGYASLGHYNPNTVNPDMKNAHGLDARLGAGLDVYLTNTFSIGANLTGEALFLHRAATPFIQAVPSSVAYSSGSSIGVGGTLTAVAGLHF